MCRGLLFVHSGNKSFCLPRRNNNKKLGEFLFIDIFYVFTLNHLIYRSGICEFCLTKETFLRLADLFHLKNFCNHNTQSKCIFWWWFSTEKKNTHEISWARQRVIFWNLFPFFRLVFFIISQSPQSQRKDEWRKRDKNVIQMCIKRIKLTWNEIDCWWM